MHNLSNYLKFLDNNEQYEISDLIRVAQLRTDNAGSKFVGYNSLQNNLKNSPYYNNQYNFSMQNLRNLAKNNPNIANWLKNNPEYSLGVLPDTQSYFGQGAQNPMINRIHNSDDIPTQELEKDLQMMNSSNWQSNINGDYQSLNNQKNYYQNFNDNLNPQQQYNSNLYYISGGNFIPYKGQNINVPLYKMENGKFIPVGR